MVMPDIPATAGTIFGFHDMVSGVAFVGNTYNEVNSHYKLMPRYSDTVFTPDAMAGEGIR